MFCKHTNKRAFTFIYIEIKNRRISIYFGLHANSLFCQLYWFCVQTDYEVESMYYYCFLYQHQDPILWINWVCLKHFFLLIKQGKSPAQTIGLVHSTAPCPPPLVMPSAGLSINLYIIGLTRQWLDLRRSNPNYNKLRLKVVTVK